MAKADNPITTNLSRRVAITGMCAAVAVPVAVRAAVVATPIAASPDDEPERLEKSEIERLGEKLQELKDEYKQASKLCDHLKRVLKRKMPAPHHSIVYSSENDADGLKWDLRGEVYTFNRTIFDHKIKGELSLIGPSTFERIDRPDGLMTLIQHKEPLPLSDTQIEKKKRLEARLELLEAYMRHKEKISAQIGLTAQYKKMDRIASKEGKAQASILKLRAQTREDFAIKISVLNDWGCGNEDSASLVKDVQALLEISRCVPAFAS